MAHDVVLIPGDGIGPEITEAMRRVVEATGVSITWHVEQAGAGVMDEYGTPLPQRVLDAVSKVLHRIQGAYALGIVCADEPDKLVAVRKDSPLILGLGQGFTMLASDVTALIRYTREVCYLDDGEMAVLTPDGVKVYNALVQPVEKETSHVDWEISAAEKGGYEHFMFKEIMEQPKAIRDTISPRLRDGKVVLDDVTITKEDLEDLDRLYVIACGSSYHVGMAAKYILDNIRASYGNTAGLVSRVASFTEDSGLELTLANFLDYYHLDPRAIYKFSSFSRIWSSSSCLIFFFWW